MKHLNFLSVFFLNFSIASLNSINDKTCRLKSVKNFDYKTLEGNWFDIARTNLVFKNKTWTNGAAQVKIENDTLHINYSGKNKSKKCVSAKTVRTNYLSGNMSTIVNENSFNEFLKVIEIRDNFVVIALCYTEREFINSDFCKIDELDIFVWSRSRIFLTPTIRLSIFDILNKNCIQSYSQIVFSNFDQVNCLKTKDNIITAYLNLEIKKSSKNKLSNISPIKKLISGIDEKTYNNSNKDIKVLNKFNNSSNISKSDFSTVDLEIKLNLINKSLNKLQIDREYSNPSILNNDQSYLNNKVDQEINLPNEKSKSKKDDLFHEHFIRTSNLGNNNVSNNNSFNDDIKRLKKDQVDLNETIFHNDKEFNCTNKFPIRMSTTIKPCPKINCPIIQCSFGRKINDVGCETCDCLKNPNVTCTIPFCHPCFYGSYTDEDGCDSCACKSRPKSNSIYECPKLDCPSCNYGSIKDEYGCESCICIRPNSPEIIFKCPPKPNCPFGSCEHGSILDEYGCETCNCLKSNNMDANRCEKLRCTQNCLHGYFTDKYGCETCKCKPEWMSPCYSTNKSCQISCKFGSYLDRNGCPSCECLPDPNLNISCLTFKNINPETECTKDGKFKPIQCNHQECRCVTQDGFPISNFKANISDANQMNCECALALFEASRFKAIGFKLYCLPNGNYEIIQCVGASCACVNQHGDPIGPSVPIYQKHLLRCEGVYQRVLYSKLLTKVASMTLVPPLCVIHRERALKMESIDKHILIPECDLRGEYLPIQCDRQRKYCWCVNVHNGIEKYGSRKIAEKPNCVN